MELIREGKPNMSQQRTPLDDQPEPSFEAAMQALEAIVEQLEGGRLSLDESLAKYAEGVGHVKRCFRLVELAERRIALLTGVDAEGNPVTERYEDEHTDLEQKAAARGKRRTAAVSNKKAARNVDDSDRLF